MNLNGSSCDKSSVVRLRAGAYTSLVIGTQRHCRCGALYHRTEAMATSREIDSFECTACGATLEKWDTAWVPTYRLITDPAIKPGEKPPTASEP